MAYINPGDQLILDGKAAVATSANYVRVRNNGVVIQAVDLITSDGRQLKGVWLGQAKKV